MCLWHSAALSKRCS